MATDPEALVQLSRLLGVALAASASPANVQHEVDSHFESLADGLTAEAADSDDVIDRDSALEYLDARLVDLSSWLSDEQRSRLLSALQAKIEAW